MKKTKFWIVVCVLLIGVATSFYFIGYKVAYDRIEIESQNFTHVNINGTILAYKKPEEGLYFIIDDDATPSYKEVIIIESTLFTDDLLKERIINREEGLYVTVEVDVWTDDLYTAALISPGSVD